MTDVRYLTGAILEFERTVDRYATRSPKIAAAFIDEVLKAVGQLSAFPESAPYLDSPIRRKVLKNYPFSLLYYLNDQQVVIIAIMHDRQPPDYWKSRLE